MSPKNQNKETLAVDVTMMLKYDSRIYNLDISQDNTKKKLQQTHYFIFGMHPKKKLLILIYGQRRCLLKK